MSSDSSSSTEPAIIWWVNLGYWPIGWTHHSDPSGFSTTYRSHIAIPSSKLLKGGDQEESSTDMSILEQDLMNLVVEQDALPNMQSEPDYAWVRQVLSEHDQAEGWKLGSVQLFPTATNDWSALKVDAGFQHINQKATNSSPIRSMRDPNFRKVWAHLPARVWFTLVVWKWLPKDYHLELPPTPPASRVRDLRRSSSHSSYTSSSFSHSSSPSPTSGYPHPGVPSLLQTPPAIAPPSSSANRMTRASSNSDIEQHPRSGSGDENTIIDQQSISNTPASHSNNAAGSDQRQSPSGGSIALHLPLQIHAQSEHVQTPQSGIVDQSIINRAQSYSDSQHTSHNSDVIQRVLHGPQDSFACYMRALQDSHIEFELPTMSQSLLAQETGHDTTRVSHPTNTLPPPPLVIPTVQLQLRPEDQHRQITEGTALNRDPFSFRHVGSSSTGDYSSRSHALTDLFLTLNIEPNIIEDAKYRDTKNRTTVFSGFLNIRDLWALLLTLGFQPWHKDRTNSLLKQTLKPTGWNAHLSIEDICLDRGWTQDTFRKRTIVYYTLRRLTAENQWTADNAVNEAEGGDLSHRQKWDGVCAMFKPGGLLDRRESPSEGTPEAQLRVGMMEKMADELSPLVTRKEDGILYTSV